MIKKVSHITLGVMIALSLTACASVRHEVKDNAVLEPTTVGETAKNELEVEKVYEVLDEHFDSFVSDVYSHPQDYNGLKYRLRAFYRQVSHDGELRNYLFKGTDERWMGFEIVTEQPLPSPGSTILALGTLKVKMEDNQETPYFEIQSLEIIREK